MNHHLRLTVGTRAKALEAGLWQTSKGDFVRLHQMADPHLVNALLKSLADREPEGITTPLAEEVARRHLVDYAMRVAEGRAR